MARRPFTKPALSLNDQITHLQSKGMEIPNINHARAQLQHVSYYRLSAYWLPFEYPKANQRPGHCFRPGTNLDTIIALHDFDCGLRRLVADAIEVVEIAIRGNWAYTMSMLGDGHSYLDPAHYADRAKFNANLTRLRDEVKKSKERFIEHYRQTYTPDEPPVWMISEILSFGSLSHWYANLKEASVRQQIADPFGLDESVFKPFIHHLTVVRNTAAHHSRLWNRQFPVRLRMPRRPIRLGQSINTGAPKQLYNTLTILGYVLEQIDALPNWQGRLLTHLDSLPYGDLSQMGFPANFETTPIWQGVNRL